MEKEPSPAEDTLILTPSQGPNLFTGIGFLAMGGALAYLAVWAASGARSQRGNYEALCAQLGDQAYWYDFCKSNAGSELAGLAMLPAFFAVVLLLAGGYWLYRSLTGKEQYVFDRQTDLLRKDGVVITPLNAIQTTVVGRYGRSFTLDLLLANDEKVRLSTYLTSDEANEQAERVAAYLGIPAHST